jgi:hypothetical protein
MRFETQATFSADRKRADGYNVDMLLWNATLKKTFLKNRKFNRLPGSDGSIERECFFHARRGGQCHLRYEVEYDRALHSSESDVQV